MKFIHRLAYFSVGLFFGIIILMFFLSGKRTSCDYSPNARTLKNIRIKDRVFTQEAYQFFESNRLDTSNVNTVLHQGKVNFGKSETDREPCNVYYVSGKLETGTLELQIENCDSIATIQRAVFLK